MFLTSLVISCVSQRVTPHSAKDDVIVSMHDSASAQTSFCVRVRARGHVFSLFRRVSEICVYLFTQQIVSPSAMAIAVVSSWNSRTNSGGDNHGGYVSASIFSFGIRKCEHLAACSKHPSCAVQVVGSLPRDELNQQGTPSAVPWSTLPRQSSRWPLKNRVTVTPWTQITSEKKHMQLWEKKDRRPRGSMKFLAQM